MPICRKMSSENKRSLTASAAMKLRISAPSNTGSTSSHSAVAIRLYWARRSHTSQKPPMPEAKSSHSATTPVRPRKAAKVRVAAAHPFAREMQERDEHEGVGRVAMEAPRERPQRKRIRRQALDRRVGAVGARVEADVDVDAAPGDDPEQAIPECAEVPPRIARLAERPVEAALDGVLQPQAARAARVARVASETRGIWPWRRSPGSPELPVKNPAILGVDSRSPARARVSGRRCAGRRGRNRRRHCPSCGRRSGASPREPRHAGRRWRRHRATARSAARPRRRAACRPSRCRRTRGSARAGRRWRRACWARAWRAPRRCARGRLPCARRVLQRELDQRLARGQVNVRGRGREVADDRHERGVAHRLQRVARQWSAGSCAHGRSVSPRRRA